MEQKKSSQDRGQFNLDFEETVLLRSKNSKMKQTYDSIIDLIDRVMNSRNSHLSSYDEELLRKAKEIARKSKK